MSDKKAVPILPEEGPNLVAIGLRKRKIFDLAPREKAERAFFNGRWNLCEPREIFEEEDQPVRLVSISVFTDDPDQMKIRWCGRDSQFFTSLSKCAHVGGLSVSRIELAPARAPESLIGLLLSLHQQCIAPRIEAIDQRGYAIGEFHDLFD